jgi:hypothetical protein
VYLTAGMAALDDSDWGSQYELMFSLWLERAECAFLTGDFDEAERLIAELLRRGTSKVNLAATYHLNVLLHVVKSRTRKPWPARPCLRLFSIDLPARVGAGSGRIRAFCAADRRPIEDLTIYR